MNARQFCADDFWNSSLTWHTEQPKLTRCLGQVGFTILPNVLFLFIFLFEFRFVSNSTNKRIGYNKYNIIRLVFCILASVTNITLFFNYVNAILISNSSIYLFSDLMAAICKIVTFVIFGVVYHYHSVKGVITSGRLFVILLSQLVCSFVLLLDTVLYNTSMYEEFEVNHVYRIFLCSLCLFVMNCFTDDAVAAGLKPPPENDEMELNAKGDTKNSESRMRKPKISPRVYSSFLSQITFTWFLEFLKMMKNKKSIRLSDIWDLEEDMKIEPVSEKFNKQYFDELKNLEKQTEISGRKVIYNSWSTVKVAWRTYGNRILLCSLLKFTCDLTTFTKPILLSLMISFISSADEPKWHGFLIVLAFIFTSVLKFVLTAFYNVSIFGIAINLRTSLVNLIYRKALRLSSNAKRNRTQGQVTNLITVDTNKFSDFAPFFAYVWSSPLQIFLGFVLLYRQLGNAVFVGAIVIVLMMYLQYLLSNYRNKYFTGELKFKDKRIELINEILSGIKIIKLYCWEFAFFQKIEAERLKEIKFLRKIFVLEMINWFLFSLSPVMVLISTIAIYIFCIDSTGLTPEKAFVSITIFNLLDWPVEVLPTIISYLAMCKISLRRISDFLREDELDNYVKRMPDDKVALMIKKKARFVWEIESFEGKEIGQENSSFETSEKSIHDLNVSINEKQNFRLTDIEIEVKKGSFTVIIGVVGAGKSSLLSAILGEMHLIENDEGVKGEINISDDQTICYVAQQAWIQNCSFKDNILFGKDLNHKIYSEIIDACALEPDLQQFEARDETEIGEKGINLSGGQKQRVSLARACYSSLMVGNGKQIILLDDPLSAVDSHVGKHLCENVLNSSTGILKNTTRLLVTNQLNQLGDLNVDNIILLENGKIALKCTYDELMEMEKNGDLNVFNIRIQQNEHKSEDEINDTEQMADDKVDTTSIDRQKKEFDQKKKELIEQEKIEIGKVNLSNYLIYIRNFGIFNAIIVIILLVIENFFQLYSRVYLADWTKRNSNSKDSNSIRTNNQENILSFGALSLGQCFFNLFANFFIIVGIVSTITLFHKQLLDKILRSPMKFFDTTPVGRIVNRFSKDIDAIDRSLPRCTREFFMNFLKLSASIFLLIFKQPNSFVYYFIIFALYFWIMNLYIEPSRQLKRQDAATRSPIYSLMSETFTGVSTIRAYGKIEDFEKTFKSRIDTNQRAFWYYLQGNRWLNFNLNMLSCLILLVVSIQAVVQRELTDESDVGLLLSYTINITQYLALTIRLLTIFETNAISIERINEYCNNVEEDDWRKKFRPQIDWPKKGEIEFKNYSTRYRENTNLALMDLNFEVKDQEKVGVVGRTGAGKSTITLALFRIIEPAKGKIIIDGVDISQIGLHDLRCKLSIIPQDPVIFSGTIRFNLDPFNEFNDEQIFRSLEHAHLKNYINTLEDGIQHKIAKNGENLSVGQRQLICLARALLRKSKILVLDEATASVDYSTDELVQKTIRTEFKDCTVLTVAHRLQTIADSSRILVLDKGQIQEYDQPDNLLANPNSMFYSLAQKANLI